jgi:hypothetical protein
MSHPTCLTPVHVFLVYACPRVIAPCIIGTVDAAATSITAVPVLGNVNGTKLHHQPIHPLAPNVSCVPKPDDGRRHRSILYGARRLHPDCPEFSQLRMTMKNALRASALSP